jgi:ABC-type sulfate transport system permease subunit
VVDHAPSLDASLPQAARRPLPLPLTESAGARAALIAAALGFLLLFLLLPLIVVFAEPCGWGSAVIGRRSANRKRSRPSG